jgi:hypothetical protein
MRLDTNSPPPAPGPGAVDELIKLGPPIRGSSVPQCPCQAAKPCACNGYAWRLERHSHELELQNLYLLRIADAVVLLLPAERRARLRQVGMGPGVERLVEAIDEWQSAT